MSDYCRFITLMMSMTQMSGDVHELDVDVEPDFRPFDGNGPRMTMLLDPSLRRILI